MKCKYALLKLNCYYQNKEIFEDDSSIEHIIPESEGQDVNNIGNLIMLEGNLNVEADNKKYLDKISVYKKSNYVWLKDFTSKHSSWTNDMIKDRAKEMAALFYNRFIKDYLI